MFPASMNAASRTLPTTVRVTHDDGATVRVRSSRYSTTLGAFVTAQTVMTADQWREALHYAGYAPEDFPVGRAVRV